MSLIYSDVIILYITAIEIRNSSYYTIIYLHLSLITKHNRRIWILVFGLILKMVESGVRNRTKRSDTANRRRPRRILPLPTPLLRRMARRMSQSSELVNDTVRVLDNDTEIRNLELMVATAPLTLIRDNPMTWTLFMRGFGVARYLMQMGSDLQRGRQEQDPHAQSEAPRHNPPTTEEFIPLSVLLALSADGESTSTVQDLDLFAETLEVEPTSPEVVPSLEEGRLREMDASVEEAVIPVDEDTMPPWFEEALADVDQPESMEQPDSMEPSGSIEQPGPMEQPQLIRAEEEIVPPLLERGLATEHNMIRILYESLILSIIYTLDIL
ncbi:hypothetical protein AGLY_015111 [Aphis glycines]|uniref:Uncharacterized protein n=1 Tax=Aphis glycines TaxID=307491 RepID=A0A6G0T1L5_APHGL|nr:hypothetical protein AGLY_015111 [Aphis glycines]